MTPDSLSSISLDSIIGSIADEFTDRLHQGETPDIEQYVQQHPQHADVIRQVLSTLQALGPNPSSSNLLADDFVDPTAHVQRTLGDFRILREIGRGGMGVVYQAEQISLGRIVALKVLPFAGVLDERQLKRFKYEARAAASLDHPHIVSVYSVGCERAVHFYAMQYVEGQSLAEIIADLRGDTDDEDAVVPTDVETKPVAALSTERETDSSAFFRRVARLGIQASEALDHAHGVGIVHRDIKPSNLMVDMAGKLLVTDFGLAQIQGEGNLTMTGDLVGTLRYMSPEQADSDRAVLDHRADIYSLGITLYELLTLRPAFEGREKAKLLRDILEHDPPAPRSINSAIPRDLETIVLKAISKDPVDRYSKAAELAEDLRRFVDDTPIHAKRISLAERAFRWVRRHSAAVSVVTALSLVISITAITAAVMFAQQGNQLAQQRNQLTQRGNELTEALAESKQHQQQADANFEIARQAVDDMYTQVAEKWLQEQPHLTKMQRDFLFKAAEFYENVPAQYQDDPVLLQDAAGAHQRVGEIHHKLGDTAKANKQFEASLAICRRLVDRDPDDDEARLWQAKALIGIGDVGYTEIDSLQQKTIQVVVVERYYDRALEILQQLHKRSPA